MKHPTLHFPINPNNELTNHNVKASRSHIIVYAIILTVLLLFLVKSVCMYIVLCVHRDHNPIDFLLNSWKGKSVSPLSLGERKIKVFRVTGKWYVFSLLYPQLPSIFFHLLLFFCRDNYYCHLYTTHLHTKSTAHCWNHSPDVNSS